MKLEDALRLHRDIFMKAGGEVPAPTNTDAPPLQEGKSFTAPKVEPDAEADFLWPKVEIIGIPPQTPSGFYKMAEVAAEPISLTAGDRAVRAAQRLLPSLAGEEGMM